MVVRVVGDVSALCMVMYRCMCCTVGMSAMRLNTLLLSLPTVDAHVRVGLGWASSGCIGIRGYDGT